MLKLGRATREAMVKELTVLFKENNSAIVARFQNIDVNKVQKLRKPLKAASARFKVVKNSMARIAVKNAKLDSLEPLFEGTCAVSFCTEDGFLNASKIFVNFSKENETFKICGGCIAGEFISYDKIKELAALPSREVLIARVVGGMKSPIANFVGILNNLVSGFIRTVDQISKKKSEESK